MKRIFKRLTVFSILVMIVFMASGCSKDPITAEQFKTKMEDKNYNIVDITSQYASSPEFIKVYVAVTKDSSYQIEYYKFDSTDSAKKAYESTKNEIENSKGTTSAHTSVSLGNYAKYTLSSDGKYTVVSRVEDTLIYSNTTSTYKDKVKEELDDLGY